MKYRLCLVFLYLLSIAIVTFTLHSCSTSSGSIYDGFSKRVVKHGQCGEVLENHFSEIKYDIFEIIEDGHTSYVNQLKFMCVRNTSYSGKVMYDRFGAWSSDVQSEGNPLKIRVWQEVDLLSTGKLYTVFTYGFMDNNYTYTSFMVFNDKNLDALKKNSGDRQKIEDYFAQAIKENGKYTNEYSRINYELYKQRTRNYTDADFVSRYEKGRLDSVTFERVFSFLSIHGKEPSVSSPYTSLLYYTGPTLSNTTGTATRSSVGKRVAKVKRKLNKQQSKMIGVCGSMEDIERYNKSLEYVLDQDSLVFKTFYQNRMWGDSYTVLDSMGNYISYFGEYMIEQIVDDLEKLKEKQ